MSNLSVITAVRNGARTITDCLQSVRSQNFPVEHVIIDGCSTDNTVELARTVSPKARIISEPDEGIYDAMNKGVSLCNGDIIGILNADDFYASPDVLAKVATVFADDRIDACYGDLVYVREKMNLKSRNAGTPGTASNSPASTYIRNSSRFQPFRYWKSGPFNPEKFFWGWMPPHPTFFVRKRVYEKHGLFNRNQGSAADYELMLRFLFKNRINTTYIPEVLVHMRAGGVSNASFRNRLTANRMDRQAWEINGLRPFPWTLWMKPLRKIPQYLVRQPR